MITAKDASVLIQQSSINWDRVIEVIDAQIKKDAKEGRCMSAVLISYAISERMRDYLTEKGYKVEVVDGTPNNTFYIRWA